MKTTHKTTALNAAAYCIIFSKRFRRVKIGIMSLIISVFAAQATGAKPIAKTPLGLHVETDGTLTLAGKPFYGMGLCMYDGFLRTIDKQEYLPYTPSLKKLADNKIPFIRVPFCGYWANALKVYQNKPAEYFREMDLFVKTCEENKIGIIATLFWTKFSVPDVVGESVNQIGNPASKTMEYARKYIREVVNRYKNSPAIWGWEIGNEFNLSADLHKVIPVNPNKDVFTSGGTPAQRGTNDQYSSQDVEVYYAEVEKVIRSIDSYRIISNGDGDYRAAQYNLRTKGNWTQDTEEELKTIMNIFSPRTVNTISVHIYDNEKTDGLSQKRFNRIIEIEDLIGIYVKLAKQSKKVLYMGEFLAENDSNFVRKINAIKASGMQLSSVWNYAKVNLSHKSFLDDSFMFTRTAEANQYYRSQGLQNVETYWR